MHQNDDYPRYVTAFVDLLGVSNSLLALDSGGNSQHDAAPTFKAINDFRSAFSTIYGQVSLDRLSDGLKAHEAAKHLVSLRPVVHSMSDCVTVHILLDDDELKSALTVFHLLLGVTHAILTVLLGNGVLVRGGIALGRGRELASGEIISTGLVRAYALEKNADAPRVLVDPPVVNLLTAAAKVLDTDGIISGVMRDTTRLLSIDPDGEYRLNLFNKTSLNLIGELRLRAAERIDRHLEQQLSAHGADRDRTTLRKWRWMETEWSGHRHEWAAVAPTTS